MIKFLALRSSLIGSQSKNTSEKTKQEQMEEQLEEITQNTPGAETAAKPSAPGCDNYDEWD